MNKTMVTKKAVATAIYNYLQQDDYKIDFDYLNYGSKDDATIADLIELKDLSFDEVTKIVEETYYYRLRDMQESEPVTIKKMTKAMSIDFCFYWISKQPNIKGQPSFTCDDDTMYFGESTLFYIL